MKEILILLYGAMFTACVTVCDHGWFGSRCQYKCHCFMNEACEQKNGICQFGCARGWFGPECQYSDLAATKVTGDTTDFKILLDNDDKTCYTDSSSATKVNITLNREYIFTWLRIHVRRPDLLYNFTVTFGKENVADNIKCNNERRAAVSDTILDIHCQLNVTIKHVILEGEAVKSFCSILISGGRNIALHETAQQSSTYTSGTIYSADLAVDGNTTGDFSQGSCTHTAVVDLSPWWSLTFQKPPRLVTRYVLYNRIDSFSERLQAFNLTSFGNDTSVVFNHIDNTSTVESTYTVIQEPWLKPVSYLVIQPNNTEKILTFCEVEVYGDSICDVGKYGKDCEHTCNCAQKESCFVSTGDCPSGCAVSFWGENCGIGCSNGTYGQNCQYNCSNHCAGGVLCKFVDVTCPDGCEVGFVNEFCNESCPRNRYGVNCSSHCSVNCVDNGTQHICDAVNGVCSQRCVAGYMGSHCNISCPSGKYGRNCNNSCSRHCAGHEDECQPHNGTCLNGCDAGYMGLDCNTECDAGKYGLECRLTCSQQCLLPRGENVQSPCSHIDGKCLLGCISGYEGLTCSNLKSYDSELKKGIGIGVGVSAGFVAITAVLIAIIICYQRKIKTQNERQQIPPTYNHVQARQSNRHYAAMSTSDLPRETHSATNTGEVLASSNREDPEGYENVTMNEYEFIEEDYIQVL